MKLFNSTTIRLSFLDSVRVLFGKRIHLITEIAVSREVEVIGTTQVCSVERFRPEKKEQHMMVSPDYNQPENKVA